MSGLVQRDVIFITSSENDVSNYDIIQNQHSTMVIKFEIC